MISLLCRLSYSFLLPLLLFTVTTSHILLPQMQPLLLFFYLFARPQLPPLILSTRPVFVFVFGSTIILPLCATTVSLQLHLTQETLQSSVAYTSNGQLTFVDVLLMMSMPLQFMFSSLTPSFSSNGPAVPVHCWHQSTAPALNSCSHLSN